MMAKSRRGLHFLKFLHLQAVKVLSGEVSHFVADPKKGYTEEVQAAGEAITLFAVAQVSLFPMGHDTR